MARKVRIYFYFKQKSVSSLLPKQSMLASILHMSHLIFFVYFIVRNEALRVAFIDEVETLKDGKVNREFYSKLVKADINGKDKV